MNPTFAVIVLGLIITGFLAFTYRFFDNAYETIETKDIVSFTISVSKMNKENIREYVSEKINAVDLQKVLENAKYIFLKPKQKETEKLNWKEIISESQKTALIIKSILFHTPSYIIVYWTISLVLIFGFWDTFASTFLINFLDRIGPGMSYLLLALIAIPAL